MPIFQHSKEHGKSSVILYNIILRYFSFESVALS